MSILDENVNIIRILDGKYYRYYKDGILTKMEIEKKTPLGNFILIASNPYINGKLDGFAISYYDSGQIKSMKSYENGVLHGKSKYFRPDGILECELIYDTGMVYPRCFLTHNFDKSTHENINIDPYMGSLERFKSCKGL